VRNVDEVEIALIGICLDRDRTGQVLREVHDAHDVAGLVELSDLHQPSM
jgi:hypothetical protein